MNANPGDISSSSEMNAIIQRLRDSLHRKPGNRLQGLAYDALPRAAVCMILKPGSSSSQLETLLVKRIESENDPWSGHMAFPGGRKREDDNDVLYTATREVFEETGIDLSKYEILGSIDEIVSGGLSVRVTPFIALASQSTVVQINVRELAEYFWIPVSFFMDEANSKTYRIKRLGEYLDVPSYPYLGTQIVWGMTLRILKDFISRIQ